jgi:hypothetical protein
MVGMEHPNVAAEDRLAEFKRDLERGGDYDSWPPAAVRRLVDEVERLRAELDQYRRGVYRLTLARAGHPPLPLARFTVAVRNSLLWEAQPEDMFVFDELHRPAMMLDWIEPGPADEAGQ